MPNAVLELFTVETDNRCCVQVKSRSWPSRARHVKALRKSVDVGEE